MAKAFSSVINGKKVVNAKKRITLNISPKDASSTGTKDPESCAAAQAAMREVPNCVKAKIHLGRAYLFDSKADKWMRFKTSDALRSEIIAFDRGGVFEPGEYDLIPLSPSDMKPARRQRPSAGVGGKAKYERKLHVVKGVRRRPPQR